MEPQTALLSRPMTYARGSSGSCGPRSRPVDYGTDVAPLGGRIRGRSTTSDDTVGRGGPGPSPCQGEGRGFESRRPLHRNPWPGRGFRAFDLVFRVSGRVPGCTGPVPGRGLSWGSGDGGDNALEDTEDSVVDRDSGVAGGRGDRVHRRRRHVVPSTLTGVPIRAGRLRGAG